MLPIVPIQMPIDSEQKNKRLAAIEAEQRYYEEHSGAWLEKSRKIFRAVRAMAKPNLPAPRRELPVDLNRTHCPTAHTVRYG